MSVEGPRAVPVDDGAIKAAAHHVCNLLLYLGGIVGGVAYDHVVAKSKPRQKIGINLCRGPGVQEVSKRQFAYVARTCVSVALACKRIGSAGVIGRLSGQSGGCLEGRSGKI